MIWLAANLVVTTLLTGTLFVPDVAVRPRARAHRRRHGRRRGRARAGRRDRHPHRPSDDGADPRAVRHPRQPPARSPRTSIILMGWSWVQAMLAGISLDYIVAIAHRLLEPGHLRRAVPDDRRDPRDLRPRRRRARRAVVRRRHPRDRGVHLHRRRSRPTRPRTSPRSRPIPSRSTRPDSCSTSCSPPRSRGPCSPPTSTASRAPRARASIGSGIGYTLSTVISMSLGATAIGYVVLSGGDAIPFDPVTIIEPFGALLRRRDLPLGHGDEHDGRLRHGDHRGQRASRAPREVPPDRARARRHLDHRLDVLRAAQPVHDVPGDSSARCSPRSSRS